jgi:hypothetical protein
MLQAKGVAENTRIRRLSVVRSMMNQTASAMPTAGASALHRPGTDANMPGEQRLDGNGPAQLSALPRV